jgi:hypothetical protein
MTGVYKNSEVEANFIFFHEAELLKLMCLTDNF